jgi:hypothetical protein
LIHHDQTLGRADHVDRAWIQALLESQRPAARGYHTDAGQTLATPLDDRVASQCAKEGHGFLRQRATIEVLDEQRSAPDLGGGQSLAKAHPDVSGGVSGSVQRGERRQR